MSQYLTVPQLKTYGTGFNFTTLGISDTDLSGAIDAAEQQINAYMLFREDNSLGFAAGPHTERHPWNRVSRRVYPHSMPVPVTSITSYVVVVGQNDIGGVLTPVQANVDPLLVVINNDRGYLECVSLAVVAFGLTPVVAQLTVIEPYVLLTYQASYAVAKVNYPLVPSDQLTYHSRRPYWDTAAQVPSVSYNGAVQAPSSYTVDATNGAIVFNAMQGAGAVTATFTHTIPDVVTNATRLAAIEALSETVANSKAPGFDLIKSPAVEVRRRGTYRDLGKPRWQEMLDTLKYEQAGTLALSI